MSGQSHIPVALHPVPIENKPGLEALN